MAKILLLAAAMGVLLAFQLFANRPLATAETQWLMGDVDCSKDVTSKDAALILQQKAGLTGALPCALNADVDVDGNKIPDSADALLVLQYVAGLIDLPSIEAFTGTVVQGPFCLALQTGDGVYELKTRKELQKGDHVTIYGFINRQVFSFCMIGPVLIVVGIEPI